MADQSNEQERPKRSSARAAARKITVDNNEAAWDVDPDDEWSSEMDEGEEDINPRRGTKSNRAGSRGASASRANRNRRTPAIDELEQQAKQLEAEIAELGPQAAALREKHAAVTAENNAIKARVAELMSEAQQQDQANIQLQAELQRNTGGPNG